MKNDYKPFDFLERESSYDGILAFSEYTEGEFEETDNCLNREG